MPTNRAYADSSVRVPGARRPCPGAARVAVGLAVQHVDLVGELVDHDVVPGLAAGLGGRGAELDVLPREGDRPAGPRLARKLVVPFVHHAVVVQLLPAHPELAGVDDDAHPAVVEIEPEIEDRQARLQRDRDPDLVGQLEVAGRGNLFLVQEQHHQLPQPACVVGRQAGRNGSPATTRIQRASSMVARLMTRLRRQVRNTV